ncbi:MAG: hypothetical protein H7Y86_04465 [Rhizobacter sp.]|nr:hypothetical protein [Ferruginibacter sp.]
MKRLLRTTCIAIAAMAFFSSCKKEGDESRTSLLMSGSWKVVKAQAQINGGAWEDVTSDNFEPCYIDNRYSFATSGVVTQDEGPTLCNPGDQQIRTDNWNFINGGQGINFAGVLWNIDELSDSKFIISITETAGGDTSKYQVILNH